MQFKQLAALLNISPSMVTRLARRGMPTDDLERARRWRKRHLHPAFTKGSRFEPHAAPVRQVEVEPVSDDLDLVEGFVCLAMAAQRKKDGGGYLAALAHLFPIMSDAQQERALLSDEIPPELWASIDEELHRQCFAHSTSGTPFEPD